MHFLAVGLNHKTAPVEVREKLSIAENELTDALTTLSQRKSVFECVIVSTCNRTEIYVVSDQLHTGRYYTKTFLAERFGLNIEELEPFLFIREDEAAIHHLFRVICGLDSLVLGETQILGQIKEAFLKAQALGTTGTFFNELFKEAVTLGKRAQSETMINDNAVSVSYAAVELAHKIFSRLNDKHVLILGAGKMGELTATHLKSHGAARITVINRTFEKAQELARKFSGTAEDWSRLDVAFKDADIIISSTGARDMVVSKERYANAIQARKGRPLFIVDIAVPRDVDPALGDIEGVFLYNIDDLEGIVEANLEERKQNAEQIEGFIQNQQEAFLEWMQTLGVVPIISALRQKALKIQAETMESIERKMPNLTERERKVISKHTKSIINQLLRDPIQRVKEIAVEPRAEKKLETFVSIFGIEDDVRSASYQNHQDSKTSPSAQVLGQAPSHS